MTNDPVKALASALKGYNAKANTHTESWNVEGGDAMYEKIIDIFVQSEQANRVRDEILGEKITLGEHIQANLCGLAEALEEGRISFDEALMGIDMLFRKVGKIMAMEGLKDSLGKLKDVFGRLGRMP